MPLLAQVVGRRLHGGLSRRSKPVSDLNINAALRALKLAGRFVSINQKHLGVSEIVRIFAAESKTVFESIGQSLNKER